MALHRRAGLILQHGDDSPPAILGDWLDRRGIEHEVHSTWRDPLPPTPGEYGWIASLGSEHTPGADGAPAWVDAEIEFLRRSLALEVPVLGLCFGGQALALAAGGAVARSEPPEIGWIEVETSDPDADPAGALAAFPLRPDRPAARLRGGRLVAGGAGGVRPRRLARAPVPPRVDPRDRRRVGAAGLRAARAARDRRPRAARRRRRTAPAPRRCSSSTPGGSGPQSHRDDRMGTLSKIGEAEPSNQSDLRRST